VDARGALGDITPASQCRRPLEFPIIFSKNLRPVLVKTDETMITFVITTPEGETFEKHLTLIRFYAQGSGERIFRRDRVKGAAKERR
jgi:hypothetical protein